MENKIHAGMRVLYKKNGNNWLIGEVSSGNAIVNEVSVFIPILTEEAIKQIHSKDFQWDEPEVVMVDIDDLYVDAEEVEDWMKSSLMTKEEYIKILDSEDFHRSTEVAWVSDGEYYYYPISKFTENWIMKQPFDYVLRNS